MAKEICISSTPHETRLAILEDDQLEEIYYERENEYTLAGSIYNGRVTRVLPGMQSAFVDIGLERDAFLYVTDFLELEDQEETDELEQAASNGGGVQIREVRSGGSEVHSEERTPRAPRQELSGEARQERRERRHAVAEVVPEVVEEEQIVAHEPVRSDAEPAQETDELSARRWRGRRRRRGNRGDVSEQPQEAPRKLFVEEAETVAEPTRARVKAARVPIEETPAPVARTRRAESKPVETKPFVLPGESLSKYGGTPAEAQKEEAAPAAPAKPAATFHPSTLIEVPLQWDGSGLLPGESLARHHDRKPEPAEIAVVEDVFVEEELEASAEPEPDAAASHNVDPAAPQGFRLFGMGGKKKKEEAVDKPARAEDDFIEEEAFAAPKPVAKARPVAEERAPRATKAESRRILVDFDESDSFSEAEAQTPAEVPAQENSRRSGRSSRGRGDRSERGGERQDRGQERSPVATPAVQPRRNPSRRSMQTTDLPVISDLLKPGQEILVQIAKEPIAKKGARITSHIALPGRFLVFMPTVSHIGVSRKIASDDERQRLKRILLSERGDSQGGFIVRTAAEGASEEELRSDLRFLLHLWSEIKLRSDGSKSPALIYHDLSLIERILRDQVSTNFSNIWVDSEADYERIVRFLNRFSPDLVRRVKLYTKETPLFEHFGIEDEISKALRSKVWLKSGGSIVINQTEALVAIDINTGKYVGKSARLEDTILRTNLDAVPEIVRQVRLRDLGGIIVIDFIDMDERKNRFKVMAALEEALKSDKAPTKVLQFNDFGLVAITRKRVKQSLERTLSVPCPTCQATGMVKSPVTVCNEIYIEMRKMKKYFENEDVTLRVHPETLKVLKSNNGAWLTELEELIGKNILPKSDPALHPEQFDVQG